MESSSNKRELETPTSTDEQTKKAKVEEPQSSTTNTQNIETPTTTTTVASKTETPSENNTNNNNNKNNNNNRGGRGGRGGRGRGKGKGRGGNARGRKGRDEEDEEDKEGDEEEIGGGAGEDDDEQDDEIAQVPHVLPEVDVNVLEAMPIDPAARKKKVAMLVGYNGAGFCGMQRNPGVRTIEDDLEVAIYKAGGISKDNFRALPKVDWMRCARTDKGVSAMGNVVSFKLLMGPPDLEEMQNRINKFLDPAIRIFSIRRVNKKFNAKFAVGSRSYEYVVPTFAFAPAPVTSTESQTGNVPEAQKGNLKDFEFTEEVRAKVNEVLALYVGSHKFHNFTQGKKPTDESANRYIISFKCGPEMKLNGMSVVVLNVVGQSFMIHQIRKMVGLVFAVARKGYLNEPGLVTIKKIFASATAKTVFQLPMAPSLGLLLDKCLYAAWDKRYASNYGSLNFDEAEDPRAEFKKGIYGYIAEKEKEGDEMNKWCTEIVDTYHNNFAQMIAYANQNLPNIK